MRPVSSGKCTAMAINSLLNHDHLLSSLPCKSPSFNSSNLSSQSHILYASTLSKLGPASLSKHVSRITAKMAVREERDAMNGSEYDASAEMVGGSSSSGSEYRKVDRSYKRSRMHGKGRSLTSDSIGDGQSKYAYRKRNAVVRKDGAKNFNGRKDDEVSKLDRIPSRHRVVRRLNGQTENRSKGRNKETIVVPSSSSSSRIGEGASTGRVVRKDVMHSKSFNKIGNKSKKGKIDPLEFKFRVGLDMCSKRGDVLGAVSLYDKSLTEGIKLEQYHYNVLLYLCSSAAGGIVLPAKSGSSGSSNSSISNQKPMYGVSMPNSNHSIKNLMHLTKNKETKMEILETSTSNLRVYDHFSNGGSDQRFIGEEMESSECSSSLSEREIVIDKPESEANEYKDSVVQVSDEVKSYALARGFEIYERLCQENIQLSEAALTSVARMAMSMGDCNMAFEMVNKMKALGINPRLRSYGPALFCFCNSGNVEKAFEVEEHMLNSGVYPEEPELEALLRMSVLAGRGDKVYCLLHKLRTSVRQVSSSTADLLEKWFNSKAATMFGKRRWDEREVLQAIENGGGGWHGLGWFGRGKWKVKHATVVDDGVCTGCGEKLATIDLDPIETENFARSVAEIAGERERNFSFQKFQKWLDYYGPFEAVIDAANVGLFSQKKFSLAKVNAIANGLRQKLPSKQFPLIIVHNRRVNGGKMEDAKNKKLIEKWKNVDALYATPTGSNDDWYWLYAAIKSKGLIVTNDEMRDHTFQLLGNDFFPKWKERHQVHFSFKEADPEFLMPPPCSVVIQESAKGHWHIPVTAVNELEKERRWLCVMRAGLQRESENYTESEGTGTPKSQTPGKKKKLITTGTQGHGSRISGLEKNKRTSFESQKFCSLVSKLEAAERHAGVTINFEI